MIVKASSSVPPTLRFGVFELDPKAGELRKKGMKIRLQGQPVDILVMLLERPGETVTREELQEKLWPADTFVDFEQGLNNAMKRLRAALDDDAESPHFIETLPRRGYRFIAPVESAGIGKLQVEAPNDGVPKQASKRSRTLRLAILFGGCVLLLGAGFYLYKLRKVSEPPGQRTLTRVTFDDGLQIGATWSPDGRYIAFSSDRGGKFDIWVQQVSGGDPIQITKGPGQNWEPDWSPDGKYIAYRSEEGDGGIYIVPALGGAGLERKIAPFGYYPRWSPNSLQVLFQTRFTTISYPNRFYVAQLDGSAPSEVLADFLTQNKLSAGSAEWYPDGKRVTVWAADVSPSPSFWMVPIAGGPGIKLDIAPAVQRKLAEASTQGDPGQQLGDYSFSWSPSGDVIYFERAYRGARNIWKMKVDPETLRATGVDRLTTGPGPDARVAVSADGRRLAYTAKSQRIRSWLFPFDATTGQIRGNGDAITSPGRMSLDPVLSADGTKVVYLVPHGERSGPSFGDVRNELWLKSLVDGREAPVISDDYSRWLAVWSPDGMQLAYERRKLGTNERQLMVWSSQSRDEEPLTTVATRVGPFVIGLETASGWWCAKPRLRRMKSGCSRSLRYHMRRPRRKRLFPIRRTCSSSHTPLLTVDGLSLRQSRTHPIRNPRSTQSPCRVAGGHELLTASTGTISLAGLQMARQFTFSLGAAVSSMSGESTSIRRRESLLGSRFRCRNSEAPA